jgi:hypothetical protein
MSMSTGTAGRRRAGAGSVLVAGLVGVVALAGCGGGSSKAKTSPTTVASASSQGSGANRQALQAYRTCLQQHGVTFGGRGNGRGGNDGTGGNDGNGAAGNGQPPVSRPPLSAADQAKRRAAQQACQSKLPSGFAQQRQQDLAAYRSCLKDHGVTLPATTDGTGGGPGGFGGGGGLAGVNRNDPKFQAANKTCAPLLPAGGFGGRNRNGTGNGTATSGPAPNAAAARAGSTV